MEEDEEEVEVEVKEQEQAVNHYVDDDYGKKYK